MSAPRTCTLRSYSVECLQQSNQQERYERHGARMVNMGFLSIDGNRLRPPAISGHGRLSHPRIPCRKTVRLTWLIHWSPYPNNHLDDQP